MAKTLIFGSSGFVGKSICSFLKSSGESVIEIDRKAFLGYLSKPKKFRSILEPSDVIIFCSAIVPAKDNEDFLNNMRLVNDFIKLLDSSKFHYLLNISSDAVYGDYNRPITESDAPNPTSIHGMMHLAREFLLNSSYSHHLGNLRPTLIYGPGDTHNSYGPNRFIRQGLTHEPIQIYGRGEERRDHIFIEDIAKIVYLMVRSRIVGNINAATGHIVDYKTIALDVNSKIPNSQIAFIDRSHPTLPHGGYREFNISKLRSVGFNNDFVQISDGITKTLLKGI